ncbi:MAG: dihydropteroate synthase [Kiritimatiellia bacterium]
MSAVWQHRAGSFQLDARTLVMGVLNVTPDSFSDGGAFFDLAKALEQARRMVADGADIIDIGGESTRPGAQPVSVDDECARVIPVIEQLTREIDTPISIDTRKPQVAAAALAAGAHIVNDVAGLGEAGMAGVVREYRAGLVVMHMQGTPQTMQEQPVYGDVVAEVGAFLRARVEAALAEHIAAEAIVADPGIGFGKTLEHNLALLRQLPEIERLAGRPLLIGVSRKRMIGAITGREVDDRLAGSLGAAAFAALHGARIIRVHDVKETCDLLKVIDRLRNAEGA